MKRECGELVIAILQTGRTHIGRLYRDGQWLRLERARCVSVWGAKREGADGTGGIGWIARCGPQPKTRLDYECQVHWHELATIEILAADPDAWAETLGYHATSSLLASDDAAG